MKTESKGYRWCIVLVHENGARNVTFYNSSKRQAIHWRDIHAANDGFQAVFIWPDGKPGWESIPVSDAIRMQDEHQEPFDWQPRYDVYVVHGNGHAELALPDVSETKAKGFWQRWGNRDNTACLIWPRHMPLPSNCVMSRCNEEREDKKENEEDEDNEERYQLFLWSRRERRLEKVEFRSLSHFECSVYWKRFNCDERVPMFWPIGEPLPQCLVQVTT